MPDKESGFCYLCSVTTTEDKGLGVFSREAIKKGSVVWRHVPGLYVVYDEKSFRAKISQMSHAEIVYELTHCFGLADFPGCLIRILDDGALINHSNNANLVTNNSAPMKIPMNTSSSEYLHKVTEALLDDRYTLVATRDIAVGEEYTNNYSADCADPPYYDALCEEHGITEDYLDAEQ